MTTKGPYFPLGGLGACPPEKFDNLEAWKLKIISNVVVVVVFAFLFLSFLFSLMKSKQTVVRGPTGSGRPPVTGFC